MDVWLIFSSVHIFRMSDIEYDVDDVIEREVRWPRTLPSRPPIRSLVSLSAGPMTPPPTLPADIKKAGEKAEEELAAAQAAVMAADKEVAAITEQLTKISTVEANRWNRRAANFTEKNKIEGKLGVAQEKRSAALAKQAALNADTQLLRGIIRLHEQTVEAYADYEKWIFSSWTDEFGDETPILSLDEMCGTPELREGNIIRYHLEPGFDVNSIYRRLRLGGFQRVRVLDSRYSGRWVEVSVNKI
jgi:hypothetical protein